MSPFSVEYIKRHSKFTYPIFVVRYLMDCESFTTSASWNFSHHFIFDLFSVIHGNIFISRVKGRNKFVIIDISVSITIKNLDDLKNKCKKMRKKNEWKLRLLDKKAKIWNFGDALSDQHLFVVFELAQNLWLSSSFVREIRFKWPKLCRIKLFYKLVISNVCY